MKIMAIEEHFLPPQLRAAWEKTAADDPTKVLHPGIIESRLDELRPDHRRANLRFGREVWFLIHTGIFPFQKAGYSARFDLLNFAE
jgi:hypothetical protein